MTQLASNDSLPKPTPEQVELAPENQSLLATLREFAKMLAHVGINVPVTSPGALVQLDSVSTPKKRQIEDGFRRAIEWFSPILFSSASFNVSADVEKVCIENALADYGLKVSEEFWKTVTEDQVVEVYGSDMKQIYRGLNFYKYTGYSLLDVSIFEWYVLWERPKRINEMMFHQAMHVVENKLKCFRFQIPKHINRETLNTGFTEGFIPRASLVEFLYCGALETSSGEHNGGLICSSTGALVVEGKEALDIQFV